MRLLLTGTRGHLAALSRDRLLESEEIVQLGGVAPTGVVAAPGGLDDDGAVRAALCGAQIVIHDLQGALDELAPPAETEPEALAALLADATARLLGAARREGVQRVIVLSSARATTLRRSPKRGPLSADALALWPRLYALRRAEDMALHYPDLALVLAPATLLGPSLPPSALLGRVLARQAGRALPARPVRLCLADARDVIGAVVSALHRGRTGQRYLLASAPFWLRTLDAHVPELPAAPPLAPPPDNLPVGVLWELADTTTARADLGWWTRRPGATLMDTLAALRA